MTPLEARMRVIEQRVRALVARRRAGDPEPDDAFRGLHVSDAWADRLLGGPPVVAEPPAGEPDGPPRLQRLACAFALSPLEVELLLIALAPDLDRRFEPLYGYLQDDVSRRRASIGLGLELCGLTGYSAEGRAWVEGLAERRLVVVEDAERPYLTRALRVPDRVCRFLLGDDRPDLEIAALARSGEAPWPEAPGGLEAWARGGHRLVYLRERVGADGVAAAAAALAGVGRACVALDLHRLSAPDEATGLAPLAGREAALRGGGLAAGPIELLTPAGIRALAELGVPVALAGAAAWDPAWSREVPLLCDLEGLRAAERARCWRASVDGTGEPGLDVAAATVQFRLTPEQVRRGALAANVAAEASGRRVGASDLRAGALAQNAAGLERLARREEPAVGLDDLVLPGRALADLGELVVRARSRDRVIDEWRVGGAAARRRGLTALFAGPSGTGKSMAAEVVAGALGLDLYVVDIATVVDKYIGETEKHLDRVFGEAARVNGVLLFDEADALFGKRSEVSDAHDRYANVEVAYLLQRMERFDGIALLATNLRSNLDEAFARRLDVVIDFPEPEAEDRHRLWERSLGTRMPRGADVDLAFLARAFKLSGGNIRNIAVAAAHRAAAEGRPLAMADLVRATEGEYRKLGRMVVESEFGPHHALLVSAR